MELSPFWLGVSGALRKISATAKNDATIEVKPNKKDTQFLSSGTPGMKHVAYHDDLNNYFVLKKARKEQIETANYSNSVSVLAAEKDTGVSNELSSARRRSLSPNTLLKNRASEGSNTRTSTSTKITSKELLRRTLERSRSRSPMINEKSSNSSGYCELPATSAAGSIR